MSVRGVGIEIPIEVDATVTGCLLAWPGIVADARVIAMLAWASFLTESATTMCTDETLTLD